MAGLHLITCWEYTLFWWSVPWTHRPTPAGSLIDWPRTTAKEMATKSQKVKIWGAIRLRVKIWEPEKSTLPKIYFLESGMNPSPRALETPRIRLHQNRFENIVEILWLTAVADQTIVHCDADREDFCVTWMQIDTELRTFEHWDLKWKMQTQSWIIALNAGGLKKIIDKELLWRHNVLSYMQRNIYA